MWRERERRDVGEMWREPETERGPEERRDVVQLTLAKTRIERGAAREVVG